MTSNNAAIRKDTALIIAIVLVVFVAIYLCCCLMGRLNGFLKSRQSKVGGQSLNGGKAPKVDDQSLNMGEKPIVEV